MIKLYNNSKLSSSILLPIFKKVMKDLTIPYTQKDIIIIISAGRNGGGTYWKGDLFKDKTAFKHSQWVSATLGKVRINPLLWPDDPLYCAEHMYRTVLHEMKHCFDAKVAKMKFDSRKVQYRKRVQEVSARFYEKYEAKLDDNLLLNLAIEIERIKKESKK